MEINKSTRHQKIIGNFGEALICNWLSRSGFEVTIVDHTGIDIVAYHAETKKHPEKRIGITVKSRTRVKRLETSSVNILSYQKEKDDRQKVLDSCQAFACEPWIGIYVESTTCADMYLLSLKQYDQCYRGRDDRKIDDWKMGNQYMKKYDKDPEVHHVHIDFKETNWEWK